MGVVRVGEEGGETGNSASNATYETKDILFNKINSKEGTILTLSCTDTFSTMIPPSHMK